MKTPLKVQYKRQLQWRDWDTALSRCPISKGQQVLDLGCGVGDVAQKLARLGAQVTGIDSNDELVSAAKADNPGNCAFLLQDARRLNLRNDSFDGLWSSFLSAYFTDFDSVFSSWVPFLKRRAWVCITDIDDLLGHEPLLPLTRKLIEDFYNEALRSRRYDFKIGSKIQGVLESHGFNTTSILLKDKELSFDGPATDDVIQGWSDRFDRMEAFKAFCGDRFPASRDELLRSLSSDYHKSNCRVICCVGSREHAE